MKSKFLYSLLGLLALCLVGGPAAHAETVYTSPVDGDQLILIGGAVLTVLEVAFRLKPTEKDWSMLNFVIRVLNAVLPANRAKSKTGLLGKWKPVIFKSIKKS